MKTIKLVGNEYVINEEFDISNNIESCISEIKGINDCIWRVNQCIVWIPPMRYIVIMCIVILFSGLLPLMVVFIYRDTELVNLFLGLISILYVLVFIFSCKRRIKEEIYASII